MSTELGEFFSLIGKARQEKEEEFQSLVGEINIDSLFAEVKTSVAEDKKKKKKKLEEDKKKKAKEKRQVKALESWLYSEPKDKEKLEIEDANGDVAFEVVDLIAPEPLKPSEPVVEEPEEISEEVEEIPEDTVDHALKILETIKSKEEVQENVGDPEIIKIRGELEYLKNLVNAQGGGGEVRLEFLDDVDRDTALVDGKFLKYQSSTKTFVGADASGGGGSDYASVAGIATFATTAGIATDAVSAGFAKTAGISTVSQGLTGSPSISVNAITAASAEFSGNVTIGGTLTYEDVKNVDSVGVVTARLGVNVTGGQIAVGAAFSVGQAGVVTASGFVGSLTGSATSLSGVSSSFLLDYNNFTNTPTIPTNNNELTNGAGYITTSFTNTNQLTNGAGFVTFTNTNQLTNGAGFVTFTNNNQLTNGAGYITTSFTNTNQLTNGAGFITASDDITGTAAGISGTPNIVVGITTVQRLSGFKSLVGAASSTTETFVITVDSKTTNHRYHGSGSSSAYFLDGIESPFLTLLPGKTYRFDQSDSSNGSHPLRFYLEADKTTAYTTNVTTNGTAGSSGAYTEILVTDSTPLVLHYQCSSHGYMGNSSFLNSNLVDTPFQITARSGINVSGIVTATSFVGDITGDVTGDVTGNADTATSATTATNAQGLTGTPNITVGIITAASAEFSGNVTIGGTITYEDVKNVDSVGLVTARTGVRITSGGLVVTAGVSTLGVVTSSSIFSTGIVTASSFVGDITGDVTGDVTGNADTATLATTATYAVNAGLATEATYAVTAGLATEATYAVTAGLATEATYAVTAGLATEATYAVTAGLATEATYAVTAGLATEATYALTAGISTFATTAGVATDVIGGIASVTTLDVTGVSTLPAISGQNINVSGIITANAFIGDGTGLTGVGGGSVISGITIREEGSTVGTAGTVVSVNFVGDNITATASGAAATITASSTPTFDSVSVGVATVSSALYVPKYTTTARDAATFAEGAIIFNTTTKKMNFYDGTNWVELPGVTLGLGMGVF